MPKVPKSNKAPEANNEWFVESQEKAPNLKILAVGNRSLKSLKKQNKKQVSSLLIKCVKGTLGKCDLRKLRFKNVITQFRTILLIIP